MRASVVAANALLLAALISQCFFAESLSIGGWYTSLKLAAADKTTCMISEPDSSQSKQMANSERT